MNAVAAQHLNECRRMLAAPSREARYWDHCTDDEREHLFRMIDELPGTAAAVRGRRWSQLSRMQRALAGKACRRVLDWAHEMAGA